MKYLGPIFLCICLAGCDQQSNGHSEKPPSPVTNNESVQLLNDVSGVWAPSQGGLVTIDYRDNELRLVIGDEPKFVKLGAIDTEQQTINLLLKRTSDNTEIIWTLHRVWDQDKTTFHLVLILDDGSNDELSFVRKITADDINRLANLYARTNATADVASAANQATSVTNTQTPDSSGAINPSASSGDDNQLIGGTNGGASFTRSQFKYWLATNNQFHIGHSNVDQDETQLLFFNHNGSIARATVLYPASQSTQTWTISYEVPRPGMLDAGAKPGDLIFSGGADVDTGNLSGTSYIFNKRCGKLPFAVHETNTAPGADSKMRVLIGNAPIVDNQTCQVVGYKELGLDFEELYDGIIVEKKQ